MAKKILLIDDEPNFCKLVKMNLELISDFEIITANDVDTGIALAKEKKPDLILLDILMPNVNGFEGLGKLKTDNQTKGIPVAMITVKGDEESRTKAAQFDNEGYIKKPIEAVDLKAKIDEILGRRGGK